MKKFTVAQAFDLPAQTVIETFRSESTWQSFAGLPFVGDPKVVSFHAGPDDAGEVKVAMSYRVSIDLPPLADRFISPDKLTFVEHTTLEADGSGGFEIVPDHYTKMLKASGRIEVVAIDDDHCERLTRGNVDVSLGWSGKLFEGPVEDAIVGGFSKALIEQAAQVSP